MQPFCPKAQVPASMLTPTLQRRKPCSRVEGFEEYLVVYRKGKIELYQEWASRDSSGDLSRINKLTA
jgi:hypothetical protein